MLCKLGTLLKQKDGCKNICCFLISNSSAYVEKKWDFYVGLFLLKQDILSYHKRSQQRLPPGLYLGYLKLCSSVDQIKVLVLQKLPNVLCHVKIRDNSNVSK